MSERQKNAPAAHKGVCHVSLTAENARGWAAGDTGLENVCRAAVWNRGGTSEHSRSGHSSERQSFGGLEGKKSGCRGFVLVLSNKPQNKFSCWCGPTSTSPRKIKHNCGDEMQVRMAGQHTNETNAEAEPWKRGGATRSERAKRTVAGQPASAVRAAHSSAFPALGLWTSAERTQSSALKSDTSVATGIQQIGRQLERRRGCVEYVSTILRGAAWEEGRRGLSSIFTRACHGKGGLFKREYWYIIYWATLPLVAAECSIE